VLDGYEVRVRAGAAVACELEHPRAQRGERALIGGGGTSAASSRRGTRASRSAGGGSRSSPRVADADPEQEAPWELRAQLGGLPRVSPGSFAQTLRIPSRRVSAVVASRIGRIAGPAASRRPTRPVAELLHELRRLAARSRRRGG
jgi:hypothetical protein